MDNGPHPTGDNEGAHVPVLIVFLIDAPGSGRPGIARDAVPAGVR
ncbi:MULTISPECIES: hypothetical protein [unclassified Streptomyces]|nr:MULTISPECIES: hypothetical protein [unclassified Streptomyces]